MILGFRFHRKKTDRYGTHTIGPLFLDVTEMVKFSENAYIIEAYSQEPVYSRESRLSAGKKYFQDVALCFSYTTNTGATHSHDFVKLYKHSIFLTFTRIEDTLLIPNWRFSIDISTNTSTFVRGKTAFSSYFCTKMLHFGRQMLFLLVIIKNKSDRTTHNIRKPTWKTIKLYIEYTKEESMETSDLLHL